MSDVGELLVKEIGEIRERIAKLEFKAQSIDNQLGDINNLKDRIAKLEFKVEEQAKEIEELKSKVSSISSYLQELYRFISQR